MKEEELVRLHFISALANGQRAQLDPACVEVQFVLRTSLPPALPAHPERHVATERFSGDDNSMNKKEERGRIVYPEVT